MTRSGLPVSLAILIVRLARRGQTRSSPGGQTPPRNGVRPSAVETGSDPMAAAGAEGRRHRAGRCRPRTSSRRSTCPPGYHARARRERAAGDGSHLGRLRRRRPDVRPRDARVRHGQDRWPIRASRSAASPSSKTPTTTARWTSGRCSWTGSSCRARSRCSTSGVLVGEPPNLWFAKDTDGDLKADTKELVRNDYGRLEGNLEHNANSLWWGDRQLDLHVRARLVSAPEERQVRGPEDAQPRPVGRRHGRRRAHLSQREHRSAVRRHRAGQLLHAQPERGAHARALRGSGRHQQDGDLAGAPDARRQSRLPRGAAARRTAPPPTTPASPRR